MLAAIVSGDADREAADRRRCGRGWHGRRPGARLTFRSWMRTAGGAESLPGPARRCPSHQAWPRGLLRVREVDRPRKAPHGGRRGHASETQKRELLGTVYLTGGVLESAADEGSEVCEAAGPDVRALLGMAAGGVRARAATRTRACWNRGQNVIRRIRALARLMEALGLIQVSSPCGRSRH